VQTPPVDHRATYGQVTQEDVLSHTQVRQDAQLLVNDGNSRVLRCPGRAELDWLASQPDLARVSRQRAGEHIQQRGLTRAVFADQRRHCTARRGEGHPAQSVRTAKRLADVAQLDGRGEVHQNVTPATRPIFA
jgi:hypothetical protein